MVTDMLISACQAESNGLPAILVRPLLRTTETSFPVARPNPKLHLRGRILPVTVALNTPILIILLRLRKMPGLSMKHTVSKYMVVNGIKGALLTSKVNGQSIFLSFAGRKFDDRGFHTVRHRPITISSPQISVKRAMVAIYSVYMA